ncbi:hypothetical protein [Chitinophaga sp. CF418]|uniref:hypothetical protein n=1 Tax=Chitinophaga sp. CF418 TaxID=1855287 RepID=UPI0009127FDE|nr:hypothetical protein [Chitinophaga sp. CF418]SHN38516.1 hypothetical protein SAMN05216311_1116 [Chitinophaga sp. CF418]
MISNTEKFRKEIKVLLIIFIISLLLSGITAFSVETELRWACSWWPEQYSDFYKWLYACYHAIKNTNEQYPYLAYGYDWLAFAHIVIAIAFIGPFKDPVKNIWIIEFGCIACISVIPLAFIAGHIRQIPVYWRLIDCSFGIIGIIPLLICHRKIKQLEKAIA